MFTIMPPGPRRPRLQASLDNTGQGQHWRRRLTAWLSAAIPSGVFRLPRWGLPVDHHRLGFDRRPIRIPRGATASVAPDNAQDPQAAHFPGNLLVRVHRVAAVLLLLSALSAVSTPAFLRNTPLDSLGGLRTCGPSRQMSPDRQSPDRISVPHWHVPFFEGFCAYLSKMIECEWCECHYMAFVNGYHWTWATGGDSRCSLDLPFGLISDEREPLCVLRQSPVGDSGERGSPP